MSILSAARNQRNPLLAQKIYDRIQPYLKDEKIYAISAPVLLANTYALAGDLKTASINRMKMTQSGLKKLAGLSWTVVNGKIVVSTKKKNKAYINYKKLFFFLF